MRSPCPRGLTDIDRAVRDRHTAFPVPTGINRDGGVLELKVPCVPRAHGD